MHYTLDIIFFVYEIIQHILGLNILYKTYF